MSQGARHIHIRALAFSTRPVWIESFSFPLLDVRPDSVRFASGCIRRFGSLWVALVQGETRETNCFSIIIQIRFCRNLCQLRQVPQNNKYTVFVLSSRSSFLSATQSLYHKKDRNLKCAAWFFCSLQPYAYLKAIWTHTTTKHSILLFPAETLGFFYVLRARSGGGGAQGFF